MSLLALHIALIIVFCILFIIVVLLCAALIVGTLSSLLGVPFVRTGSRSYSAIFDALEVKSGDVVYELGSGDGGFSLALSKAYPAAQVVGIERNPFLHSLARIRRRLWGNPPNLSFRRENFFSTDLTAANKIYAYLIGSTMDGLLPKFERELRSSRIVSRAFTFEKKSYSASARISKRDGGHGQHMLYVYEFN